MSAFTFGGRPSVGAGCNPGGLWYVVDLGDGIYEEGPISSPAEADILGHRHRLLGNSSRLYDGDTGKLVGILRADDDVDARPIWNGRGSW